MAVKSDPTALGPWADADLGGTARANVGIGADSDLPTSVRFIRNVAMLIRRRLALDSGHADPARPGVFLLEPVPRPGKSGAMPQRVPMLDNGLTALAGRLWFVSAVVVTGNYVELEDCDDAELFRIITDDLHLGQVPAVVFDPRTPVPEVRFYPNGLQNAEDCTLVTVATGDVSLDRIFDAIDLVHKNCLVTPEAQPKAGNLWEDKGKWWASSEAEDMIQVNIKAGLAAAFPTCTVRHEQVQVSGRLDLEIEESDAVDRSQVTRHAVLELKVLRSYRSTGTTVAESETLNWVEEGVKQAAAYRNDRGARQAALCCFDMRQHDTGEKCFEHIREQAVRLSVILKRWFLYATSSQYRDAATERG